MLWMLYSSFWVIPRRLYFMCRRFGTLCWNSVFRNVGTENPDAKESPKRKNTTQMHILLKHVIEGKMEGMRI
jgi:hypothetical protein